MVCRRKHMISKERLESLDVFRGLAIALMILVNSPGNDTPYIWLDHSEWHGCTLVDLIFPSFVFIVGVSTALRFSKVQNTQGLVSKIFRRSLFIFLIGLLLNANLNHFDSATLRIYGVL